MSSSAAEKPITPTTAVVVPSHVVFRAFAAETIILNLESGTYHGLNPTAGRMLETLRDHPVIADAAMTVAEHYKTDIETVQADLIKLCSGLIERGLLAVQRDA
jgi:Coenzyme PQQ synthesis protein D (PqqD)